MMNMTVLMLFLGLVGSALGQTTLKSDTVPTSGGDLTITFIGHGSLMFDWNKLTIQVDPYGKLADYSLLPKADLILVTHDHPDHLDPQAISLIRGSNTATLTAPICAGRLVDAEVLATGAVRTVKGIRIEAVPAYNIVNRRSPGKPFHAKGEGVGFLLTFGDKRIYVAGDTENTPEMKALKAIDVAFLPMNLPYTMTPEMVADAARAFKPKILYPYHFGETDTAKLQALLRDTPEIEVRVRPMK